MKPVFLLGGHDLEMETIRKLLESIGFSDLDSSPAGNGHFADRNLRWDNSFLSKYSDILETYGNRNGCHIYGIELRPDPPAGKSDGQSDQPDGQRIALPANYTLIDHHDEDSDKESSLEQVFKILQTHYAKDIEWTRELELVAANDSKYIPGMKAIPDEKGGPASDKEIADIRFRDRRAQGITPDMEEAAKKAMHENLETGNNLIVVKDVPTGAFSAVCDNLYPYGSLLIYNSDEFCFYGKRAEEILALISGGTMTVDPKRIYYGGGKDGFVGWSSGTTSDKDRHVEDSWINGIREFMDIETYSPDEMAKNPGGKKAGLFSYHIFYFPFKWDPDGSEDLEFSQKYDLSRLAAKADTRVWERVNSFSFSNDSNGNLPKEAKELFGEKQYFYEFVHPVLYDGVGTGPDDNRPLILHFERKETKKRHDVNYVIRIGGNALKEYILAVDSINLNFYSTGVGMLTFYLRNENVLQAGEKDIRQINQYGRRIMPPHCGEFDPKSRTIFAQSLEITGLDEQGQGSGRYFDDFSNYSSVKDGNGETADTGKNSMPPVWTPSKIILSLIHDLAKDIKIGPVIDDRMFVNCCIGNNVLSRKFMNADITRPSENRQIKNLRELWYKQIFIDESNDPYCQNDSMLESFVNESTYSRWQKYGTMYGATRYSLVCITSMHAFSLGFLSMHMHTIYSRLFELVILQKASVLRFSDEVTHVSNLDKNDIKNISDRISSLYREYIRFVNRIYFRDVTAQDQGIELYALLSRQFGTEKQIRDLDDEISELNQYASIMADQQNLENDRRRNENGERLNKIASFFLPASMVAGIFGMNMFETFDLSMLWELLIMIAFMILGLRIIMKYLK